MTRVANLAVVAVIVRIPVMLPGHSCGLSLTRLLALLTDVWLPGVFCVNSWFKFVSPLPATNGLKIRLGDG